MNEPWDHGNFGWGYGVALIVAAGLGAIARSHAWLAGLAVIFAMVPVMLIDSGVGPLLSIGIIFLVGLSLPAGGTAELGHFLTRRISR